MEPHSSWSLEATRATFADGTFHTAYRGVELQKHEDDLARYLAVVDQSKPDLIIETGTRYGASALWFNQALGPEVVTIDIEPKLSPTWATWPGIKSIRGNSLSKWVFEELLKVVRGKRVMVSLDSDHHSAHVQGEIAILGSLVSPGCYLVVEDACYDLFHRAGHVDDARRGGARIPEWGGPFDAIERQLDHGLGQQRPFFIRDEEIEAMSPISHSPCGWWRRRDA
jgi:cephalosporin hydroxylase